MTPLRGVDVSLSYPSTTKVALFRIVIYHNIDAFDWFKGSLNVNGRLTREMGYGRQVGCGCTVKQASLMVKSLDIDLPVHFLQSMV